MADVAHGDDIGRDLPPDLDPGERESLVEVGVRLSSERPVPNPNFRGDLRRALLSRRSSRQGMAPRTVRALSASYACSGIVLLAVAALGLAGGGPFAP